jgi:hypothetical protein
MSKGDFSTAVKHLEIAYQGDQYHRGVIKALGLSLLWNGQVGAALPLLSGLPETNQELSIYEWWWLGLNHPNLAAYAEQYLVLVGSGQ